MSKKTIKPLQDLTFKDEFMFGAVMTNPEICAGVVERCLGIPIERVEIVSNEYSLRYNPNYKGIRLDAYARDSQNTRYNIEMQTYEEKDILKRSRYYQSQIDMELLLAGEEYEKLPNTYVIFICDYDPFGLGLYKYSDSCCCKEDSTLDMSDGTHKIILSTVGKNSDEISSELLTLLTFSGYNLEESNRLSEDEFIKKIQATVQKIKEDREKGAEYMRYTLELQKQYSSGMKEGREEGRKEGREEGRKEGREEGRKEGREEGRKEGREEGRKEGREEGRAEAIVCAIRSMLEFGISKEQILEKYTKEEYELAMAEIEKREK